VTARSRAGSGRPGASAANLDRLLERAEVGDRLFGIDRVNRAPDIGYQSQRRHARAHEDGAVPGEVDLRVIHLRERIDIELELPDVADDSDNLPGRILEMQQAPDGSSFSNSRRASTSLMIIVLGAVSLLSASVKNRRAAAGIPVAWKKSPAAESKPVWRSFRVSGRSSRLIRSP